MTLVESLRPLGVSFEGATTLYFALDLLPAADIGKVRDVLDEWSKEGIAEYETCEAKIRGSSMLHRRTSRKAVHNEQPPDTPLQPAAEKRVGSAAGR